MYMIKLQYSIGDKYANMPPGIYLNLIIVVTTRNIAKYFWDNATKSNNPKVRAFLAEEFWAGGYGALRKYKDKPYSEFGIIKKNRYIALSKLKPKYKRGWAKRNNEFISLLNKYRDE